MKPKPTSDAVITERERFSRFAKRVALVAFVAAVVMLTVMAAQVFLAVFAAILLAVLVTNLGNWLASHTPLSYRWAVGLGLLGVVALLAGAMALMAPNLTAQVEQMRSTLPESFERVQQHLEKYKWARTTMEAAENPAKYLPEPENLVKRVAGVFSTTFGILGSLLIVLFLGICLAVEPRTYCDGLVRLLPPLRRDRGRQVLKEMHAILTKWLLSIFMSMSVVGILTGIGLWLLGVPMVFALALLAFLLAFVPNVGPVIAAAPAVLVAFTISPSKALYVVLLYVGIQTIESNFITPIIARKTVSLPPALTGTVQLLLGLLTGLPGVIVAAPLTAVGMVFVRRVYVEDALGEADST